MSKGDELVSFGQALLTLVELVKNPGKIEEFVGVAADAAEIERKYDYVRTAEDKLVRDRADAQALIDKASAKITEADTREQAVAAKEAALVNVEASLSAQEDALKTREKAVEAKAEELEADKEALESSYEKLEEQTAAVAQREATAEATIKEYNEKLQSLAALSKGA